MALPDLKGKRICVIDDQADNVYILLMMLKQHGATGIVTWWSEGQIKQIKQHLPIDAILLDLMFPGHRTGFDVIAEIRAIPGLEAVPIAAVSAADAAVAMAQARECGFDGFISKPIDAAQFPLQLKKILAGQPVWAGR